MVDAQKIALIVCHVQKEKTSKVSFPSATEWQAEKKLAVQICPCDRSEKDRDRSLGVTLLQIVGGLLLPESELTSVAAATAAAAPVAAAPVATAVCVTKSITSCCAVAKCLGARVTVVFVKLSAA